ncbi:MAG: peptidylprolyl isomerase [Francisellaceae bacterium]
MKQTKDTPAQSPELINEIVAIVNDQPITLDELNLAVIKAKAETQTKNQAVADSALFRQQVLQQLINQTLALQLAAREHIVVSDDEVNEAIATILSNNGLTMDVLKQQLAATGLSFNAYFQTVKDQLIISKIQQKSVAGQIFISPKEIENYIEKHFSSSDDLYEVKNILLSLPQNANKDEINQALQKADALVKQIETGKITFADAALKYSQSGNAQNGGDLGWKTLTDLPTIYADKIESMKVEQISSPFIANNGIQIVKLAGVKANPATQHFIESYHVRQIVIKLSPVVNDNDAKARLERILTAIKNGQSFEQLAKSNSQNYDNATEGGDMGWVSLDQLPPTVAKEVKEAKPNVISQPFKVNNDEWQIIEVLGSKKVNNTKDYQQKEAMNALFQQKAPQALKTWMLSLKDNAYIKIVDPELDSDAS